MKKWLNKLFGSPAPPPKEEPPPVAPPDPWPQWLENCDTLALYGLGAEQTTPSPGTLSLVLHNLDPQDQQNLFNAPKSPQSAIISGQKLTESLREGLTTTPLRDPNSRARVHWALKWLEEHRPAQVACSVEPFDLAGDGTAPSKGASLKPPPAS